MKTAYWLQGGGCGGDTYSFLSSEFPNVVELLRSLNIKLVWHPSFSHITPTEHEQLIKRILAGDQPLDILLVEGSIICGPAGTGMFHTKNGQPKKGQIRGQVSFWPLFGKQ
ncbi:MAG: hypothetical protein GY702_03690 [Desulfobulbaceae bacterium]|nr:hypothetical protein [Desulfobulbaceae bacterium]